MEELTELYCKIDDFYRVYAPLLKAHAISGKKQRNRSCKISVPELMTLLIWFHQMRYRQFKAFYLLYVSKHLRREFPQLPSYTRCIELLPRCIVPLIGFFNEVKGQCTGLSIVDSTALAVCDNLRIGQHRVFKDHAQRSKTSTGWFFGFKLHLMINHFGEIFNLKLTPGNVDDRKFLWTLNEQHGFWGKFYADKGYISKSLTEHLKTQDIDLVTKHKRNMKSVRQHTPFDLAMLKQRTLIETVIGQLKQLCYIEHSRHRSPANFIIHLMAGLVTYCLTPNKPKLAVSFIRPLIA